MTLRFTGHALDEMAADQISSDAVRAVLANGLVLQHYPEDTPFPSRLMLGWYEGVPVHVVCANETETAIVVITVYRPDSQLWDATFTKRVTP